MNWQELAATSHYQTAVAIARELAAGHTDEAADGLQELIDAVARSERRALRSQLVRLMLHVLKWKNQPERRSASWTVTILQAREEIAAIQEEVPSLNRAAIEAMWESCLQTAARQARAEMGRPVTEIDLSWQDVFRDEYDLS